MGDTLYRIVLRSDPGRSRSVARDQLEPRLVRIPQVHAVDGHRFRFGEGEGECMEIAPQPASSSEDIQQVDIDIPRSWLPARGPQVFALVFMMSEWMGFEVFDQQIGDTLDKGTVLQGLVAMRQAHLEGAGGQAGPPPPLRTREEAQRDHRLPPGYAPEPKSRGPRAPRSWWKFW